jgi:hypothetical protein
LNKSCTAPAELELKIGSQVILLKNLDDGLVNGSRGVVTSFSVDDHPIVKFNNFDKEIQREEFKFSAGSETLASRSQYPLALAWAISIHKAQGMTIDILQTKLDSVFEYGQTYVALSRCSSLKGLSIKGFDPKKIKAHPKVIEFYSKFKKNLEKKIEVKEIVKEEEEFEEEDDDIVEVPIKKDYQKKETTPKDEDDVINISDESQPDSGWIKSYKIIPTEVKEEIKEEKSELKILQNLNGLIIGIQCNSHSVSGAKCQNNQKENPITFLFKKNHFIESTKEHNGSLLLYFPFFESVNIGKITFGTRDDSTKPNKIQFFINEGELSFDDLKDVKPREEFNDIVKNIVLENKSEKIEDLNVCFFNLKFQDFVDGKRNHCVGINGNFWKCCT